MNNIASILRPELTRLLLSQLRDRQSDIGASFSRSGALPSQPAGKTPAPASTDWQPSAAAMLLVNIAARNHETPPKILVRVQSIEPDVLSRELRSSFEEAGMSYHAKLAQAVESGKPILQAGATPPAGQQPFDNAVMAALTGQIHTLVDTPAGKAAIVWHRTEEDEPSPRGGYMGKIHSASIAVEHPDFGPIIANLDLMHKDLSLAVRCLERSAEPIKDSLPTLVSSLWGAGVIPAIDIATLPHDHE